MELEKRNIEELVENSINTRIHGQKQIDEFKKSINKFNVIRPVVIDENNVILAGHGLFLALKQLGRKDVDVVVVRGLSERDKKKLLLSDNKIYSLGADDYTSIESLLKELGSESDFDVPGYDSGILEELYGIRSVEKEIGESKPFDIPNEDVKDQGNFEPEPNKADRAFDVHESHENPVPSEEFKAARQEAQNRKFVICPNCGEKIWL